MLINLYDLKTFRELMDPNEDEVRRWGFVVYSETRYLMIEREADS
jgi:hypothetical protein